MTARSAPRRIPGLSPRLRLRLQRFFRLATRMSPRVAARLALELFVTPPRRRMEAVDKPIVARAKRRPLLVGKFKVSVFEWRPAGADAAASIASAAASSGAASQPAVLLLHGWGSHAARFGSFVDPLLAAGYRVIALDAPAHGESSGRRSDMLRFRKALAQALRELGPVRAIVAHSMGAGASVSLLADEPHPDVRALVLIGMPSDLGYMMESFELILELRADVRRYLRRAFERRFGRTPESFSAHALAASLAVPTFVVHDELDDVAPIEHARGFAVRLGTSGRLRVTSGLDHSGPLRDPGTIAAIVAFIEEQTRKA